MKDKLIGWFVMMYLFILHLAALGYLIVLIPQVPHCVELFVFGVIMVYSFGMSLFIADRGWNL